MIRTPQPPDIFYEVIDVEMGNVFHCSTPEGRDAYKQTIELLGRRALVREIRGRIPGTCPPDVRRA